MTFNLRNKDNYLWNAMITVLVLTLHSSVQLKLNGDVKWTVTRTQKQKPVRNKTA